MMNEESIVINRKKMEDRRRSKSIRVNGYRQRRVYQYPSNVQLLPTQQEDLVGANFEPKL